MFNTTYVVNKMPERRVTENSFIKIQENRAPTDESVRLLNEMEQAAYNNLLKSYSVSNSMVESKIFFFASIDDFIKYRVIFKINEKEVNIEGKIDRLSFKVLSESVIEIGKIVMKHVSEYLTIELLTDGNTIKEIEKITFLKNNAGL